MSQPLTSILELSPKLSPPLQTSSSSPQQQPDSDTYLATCLPPKLQQIFLTLLTELQDLEQKSHQSQKKLLHQLQEKDKLILSLTKINSTLMKQNTRLKKKSQAQFQYFVKRIAETECTALNDKKNLQEAILMCQEVICKLEGGQGRRSEQDQNNGAAIGKWKNLRISIEPNITPEQIQKRITSVKDLNIQLMNLPATPRTPKTPARALLKHQQQSSYPNSNSQKTAERQSQPCGATNTHNRRQNRGSEPGWTTMNPQHSKEKRYSQLQRELAMQI